MIKLKLFFLLILSVNFVVKPNYLADAMRGSDTKRGIVWVTSALSGLAFAAGLAGGIDEPWAINGGVKIGLFLGGGFFGLIFGFFGSLGAMNSYYLCKERNNIFIAIKYKDIKKIKRILKANPAIIEMRDENGWRPLAHAFVNYYDNDVIDAIADCSSLRNLDDTYKVLSENNFDFDKLNKIRLNLANKILKEKLDCLPNSLIRLIADYSSEKANSEVVIDVAV